MLIDRRNFWQLHGWWLVVVCAGSAAAAGWCVSAANSAGRWPGGGSAAGLTLGGLAAFIFLFELALVAKKTRFLRTARWTLSAQTWMKAHIWLGLFTVPLVLLHSGCHLGGSLTMLLIIVFAVVIVSGLWGLALQNLLPRMLLEGAPAETIYSQIDAVGRQYAAEARRLVFLHCGDPIPLPPGEGGLRSRPGEGVEEMSMPTAHIRGAPRPVGTQIKRTPHPQHEQGNAIPSPAIADALHDPIERYLCTGESPHSQLGSRQRNQWFFDDLRLRVAPELRSLVAQLEELCERRRQLNLQRQLHFWLHNWLWLHLPLSVLLVVLLAAHVLFALRYD